MVKSISKRKLAHDRLANNAEQFSYYYNTIVVTRGRVY